jgi:chloride channel 3/4/5
MSASPVLGTIGLSEPSSTTWRRERLLRIGSSASVSVGQPPDLLNSPEASPTEHTTINPIDRPSYGTMPLSRRRLFNKPSLNLPNRALSLSGPFLRSKTLSNPASPIPTSAFRDIAFSRLSLQRPIPAYDAPLHHKDDVQPDTDARVNGIRVWYSSFSSVDWLHDAIKDSVRFARLRRRTSLRARIRLMIDKSLGWFIVTIVGVLTALLAFFIVRSELWLFDTKDGYCREEWWKAKRFCCPKFAENNRVSYVMSAHMLEDRCPEWRTWADVFSQIKEHVGGDVVEYVSYAVIAVRLSSHRLRFFIHVLARSHLLSPRRFLLSTSPTLPHSLRARNLASFRRISPYLTVIPKTK